MIERMADVVTTSMVRLNEAMLVAFLRAGAFATRGARPLLWIVGIIVMLLYGGSAITQHGERGWVFTAVGLGTAALVGTTVAALSRWPTRG